MSLIAIQPLGRNRDNLRLGIESRRLETLGFTHGTPLEITSQSGGLTLRPAILGENHVSSRALPDGRRPIIDLANQSLLSGLADYSAVKIIASFERIQVSPSHRAFAIQKSRSLSTPFRVLEVFAGGGTMTAALDANRNFQVVAGLEIEPDFADEWQARHPDATLVQSDMRALHSSELPEFDVLIGGIPCTSHSNLGRAKKGLAGKPELGDTGDLFLPVVTLISERMPAAVVFENVPSFGTSLAGELLVSHLRRIGYHVSIEVLRPNEDWGELEDRKRWLLVGTLDRPFTLQIPREPCRTPAAAFLDAPDSEQDCADAERIARTIEGLRAHNARHKALVTVLRSLNSPETNFAFLQSRKPITRSTPGRSCRLPLACDYSGRPRLSASTVAGCCRAITPPQFRCWDRECRQHCFAKCLNKLATTLQCHYPP